MTAFELCICQAQHLVRNRYAQLRALHENFEERGIECLEYVAHAHCNLFTECGACFCFDAHVVQGIAFNSHVSQSTDLHLRKSPDGGVHGIPVLWLWDPRQRG